MRKKYLKFLGFLINTPIFNLLFKVSGDIWDKSEWRLFEFNKTIITLSSSTLVLSFSLINLIKLSIDGFLIAWSWFFLTVSLILGVTLYYMRFITFFLDRVIEKKADAKLYNQKNLLDNNEIIVYYSFLNFIFIISFVELFTFILGILFLMVAAYGSLK